MTRRLVLASSSPYRRALLDRLGLDYSCRSPDIDETPRPGEDAESLVLRLAEAKARAVAEVEPDALIIGSDQVATLEGRILGKPLTVPRACDQLRAASGKRVRFLTGLCLYDSARGAGQQLVEPFDVVFRILSEENIRRYVEREQPLNCAGSFKSEGLGIVLFERLQGDDPNALIGLPLIRLVSLLESAGCPVLGAE